MDLYELVSPWHDDRLLPWLIDRLESAELSDGTGRRMMTSIAEALDDGGLADLQATGEAQIRDLEQQLYNADDDAARQRFARQLETAEEELRRRFIEALGRLGRR